MPTIYPNISPFISAQLQPHLSFLATYPTALTIIADMRPEIQKRGAEYEFSTPFMSIYAAGFVSLLLLRMFPQFQTLQSQAHLQRQRFQPVVQLQAERPS